MKSPKKSCVVNTKRFLKYTGPFLNIIFERVKSAFKSTVIVVPHVWFGM